MKKIILLMIIAAFFNKSSNAQYMPDVKSPAYKNIKGIFKTNFPYEQVTGFNNITNKKKLKEKDLYWNWDTVICYDTSDNVSKRYSQICDSDGNGIIQLTEIRDTNAWVNFEKSTLTYDSQGNLLLNNIEKWKNNNWEIYFRFINTYDSAGNILNSQSEQWSNNQWKVNTIFTYLYDSAGVLTESYFGVPGQWFFRHIFVYDTNGYLITMFTEVWDNNTNTWWKNMRCQCSYNQNGNDSILLYESWDSTGWVNHRKQSYFYDSYENNVEILFENWDNIIWVNSDRCQWEYDAYGNSISGKNERWINGSWLPLQNTLLLFSGKDNPDYFPSVHRFEAHFNSFASGISKINEDAGIFSIYPNPATTTLTLQFAQLSKEAEIFIYDMQGRLLLQKEMKKEKEETDVSGLAKGLYIVKVKDEKGVAVRRFVKE